MKITVKIKDVEICIDDQDNTAVIKYGSHNKEVQETIKVMTEQCLRLYKERQ